MLTLFPRSRSKQECFWNACSYGREETVRSLIENGVNLNWKSHVYESYPIHVASQGKPIVLELLLQAGCLVDSLDGNGNTALHHAAMSGCIENVTMLILAGANINARNKNDWTPLFNSVYWNHPVITAYLLSKGANPFFKNKEGRNTLHELCRSKSRDSNALLQNLHAVLDYMDKADNECTLSDNNKLSANTNSVNLQAELRNIWDSEANFTPLLFACYHGHLELVKVLLERGADIHYRDQNGWTALHWAAQRCHADIVEVLLDHGASRSAKDLRGDMPFSVTNDIGLRDCLLPDPAYPTIVSNGYVTTDEEDEDDDDEGVDSLKSANHKPTNTDSHLANDQSNSRASVAHPNSHLKLDLMHFETMELSLLGAQIENVRLAIAESMTLDLTTT